MRTAVLVIMLLATVLLALPNLGCTRVLGAAQVGNEANATWVFVQTNKGRRTMIYRCVDLPDGPVCKPAKMQ
jgi:hypothetical protein